MSVTNGNTVSSVVAPDGTQVYPSFKDRNGNYYSKDSNGNIIDTLGRTPVTVTNNCNGNSNQICYAVLNSQGGTSTITVTTASISVHTAFNRPYTAEASATQKVIQSVQLPDGTSYQVGYDSGTSSGHYGEITSITLPTNGQATYAYSVFQDANGDINHWVSQRSFGGGSWSFSPGNVNTSAKTQSVTVTKPSGDYKVYSFSLNNGGWMNSLTHYQAGNSNALMTVNDTWDVSIPCTPPCAGSGSVYIRKSSETVSTDSVARQTSYSYAGTIDSFPVTVKEWNYYSGAAPSTPTRITNITYLSDTNSAYGPSGKNILNLRSKVIVTDGSGNQLKETDYGYDGTSLTSASLFTQHDDANFGTANSTRGNLTTAQRWKDGASYIVTDTLTYDTTGQIVSVKDQRNNITSFTYTDCYANDNGSNPPQAYTPAQATHAYLTTTTLAASGTLTTCYYFGSGKVAYGKDQNLATTYHHFQDLDDRATTDYFPIGWRLTTYTSATQSDTYVGIQDSTPSISCTSCRHDRTLLDNLGRVSNRILVSDPDGQTTVSLDYDSNSRILDAIHPYRTTSDPTYGLETISYDALDQPAQVTHPDGTTAKTYYGRNVSAIGGLTTQQCGSCQLGYPTAIMDEAGKIQQVWTDAFGKTVEMDEPASNASTGGGGTSTGTITFSGSEQSVSINHCPPNNCWSTIFDGGSFTVTIGGYTTGVSYGSGSTSASLASSLASTLNSDPASPVTGSASGSVATLTSKFNYSLSAVIAGWNTTYFSQPSFTATVSGPNLTGGTTPQMSSPTVTYYLYDLLGNLTQATVVNSQECNRTYAYDHLSRITSATEPETGNGNGACPLNSTHTTSSYYTKADGTLCSGDASAVCRRTDGRGITTTYTYDVLNRLTGMSYSDSTPSVTYSYDQTSYNGLTITNGKGRRTGMSDASGITAWSYDLNGNVLTEKRQITAVSPSVTKTTSYAYNKDNSLNSLTYPTGRVVNFTVSNAQRTTAVVDSNGAQYVSAPTSGWMYTPNGKLSSAVYGKGAVFTGLTESRTYNNRLQLTGVLGSSTAGTALNLAYAYTDTNHSINNSELVSVTNNGDTGRTQSFTYDDLSRVTSAASQAASGANCWGQNFTVDKVANLTNIDIRQCTATSLSAAVNGYNQFTTGYTYDAAGNMTNDGSYAYTYNAENEITSANGVTYTYDGDRQRVKKSSGMLYWRTIAGAVIAETNLSGATINEYVFFAGRRVARRDSSGNLYYSQMDHLGTTRSITKVTSGGTASICYDADFTPYGSEMTHTNTCAPTYKFTGYERDSETGLDYAMNRYYSSRSGRFMSADAMASTNRYAYALNNPLSLVDPLGLQSCAIIMSGGASCPDDPSASGLSGYSSQPDLSSLVGGRGNCGIGTGCYSQAESTYVRSVNLSLTTPPPGSWVPAGGNWAKEGCLRQAGGDKMWCPSSPIGGAAKNPMDWVIEDYSLLRLKQNWWKWALGYGAKVAAVKVLKPAASTVGYLGGLSTLIMLGSTMLDAVDVAKLPPPPTDPCMGVGINWVPGPNGITVGVAACQ